VRVGRRAARHSLTHYRAAVRLPFERDDVHQNGTEEMGPTRRTPHITRGRTATADRVFRARGAAGEWRFSVHERASVRTLRRDQRAREHRRGARPKKGRSAILPAMSRARGFRSQRAAGEQVTANVGVFQGVSKRPNTRVRHHSPSRSSAPPWQTGQLALKGDRGAGRSRERPPCPEGRSSSRPWAAGPPMEKL